MRVRQRERETGGRCHGALALVLGYREAGRQYWMKWDVRRVVIESAVISVAYTQRGYANILARRGWAGVITLVMMLKNRTSESIRRAYVDVRIAVAFDRTYHHSDLHSLEGQQAQRVLQFKQREANIPARCSHRTRSRTCWQDRPVQRFFFQSSTESNNVRQTSQMVGNMRRTL